MCKETFLRLPEEKRARILNAAWEEFTSVSFVNASINRIVRNAGIPRGSFYQYFDDKSDLFQYLMRQVHDQLTASYKKLLSDADGDIFRAALMGYDRFLSEQERGNRLPVFDRCIRIIRINPGMDLETLGHRHRQEQQKQVLGMFLSLMDLTPFRRQDREFLTNVSCMTWMCLISVLMDSLMNPGGEAERRRELAEALDILRRGSYRTEALRKWEEVST